ncbi:hypothetical protein [Niallia sp. 01092]|uniref:hypothetical protein n=1 Tax=unclassified Niallia TaxID=2837522 RepID=UPI003FD39921
MDKVDISQPIALFIEQGRANGIADKDLILALKEKNFHLLKLDEQVDAEQKLRLAEELGNDWEKAISNGYRIRFLSIHGLKNLLKFKYNKIVEIDYKEEYNTITLLKMSKEDIASLTSIISGQWNIVREDSHTCDSESEWIQIKLKNELV